MKRTLVILLLAILAILIKFGILELVIYICCMRWHIKFDWLYIMPIVGLTLLYNFFPLHIKIDSDD